MMIPHRYSLFMLGLSVCVMAAPGCASRWDAVSHWALRGWEPTVAKAERRAIETGRPVLFYYKDARIRRSDIETMIEQVVSAQAAPRPVRCILYSTNERDRRYAAQFGVEIPPTLILVYPDGSYHAKRGPLNQNTITQFLAESHPPGASPRANPYLRSRLVSKANPK